MELPSPASSWFSPTEKDTSKSFKYTYKEFVKQAELQILRSLGVCEETGRSSSDYYLEELTMTVEARQFEEQLLSLANAPCEKYYPLLTYHSTQNPTKCQGILKYGYLLPGETHPTKGWELCMATGNLYGDGVYTSPVFQVAQWYSFLDYEECIQVIVNIQLPGKQKVVENSKWFPDKRDPSNLSLVIPTRTGSAGGAYQDLDGTTYDSLRSSNMEIWVTGSTQRILPIAIVHLRPNKATGMWKIPAFNPMPTWKQNLSPEGTHVPIYHIADDYFVLSSVAHDAQNQPMLPSATSVAVPMRRPESHAGHSIFCIPASAIGPSHTTLIRALANFVQGLEQESKHVIFYHNDQVIKHKVTDGSQFVSHAASFAAKSGAHATVNAPGSEKILPVLGRAIDLVTSHDTGSGGTPAVVHTVYVFAHHEQSLQDAKDVQALIDAQQGYLKVKQIIVKLIVIHSNSSGTAKQASSSNLNHLSHLKASIQNCHFFEQWMHECSEESVAEVMDVLHDESFNFTEHEQTLFSMPFPLGIAGQGFVPSLEGFPVWDAPATAGTEVLYKGTIPQAVHIRHPGARSIAVQTLAVKYHADMPVEVKMKYGETIIVLLARFRNYVLRFPERCRSHSAHVVKLCESLISLLSFKPTTTAPVTATKPATSTSTALTSATDLKLLSSTRATLKMQAFRLISDIRAFGKLPLDGKWFDRFANLKFGKAISKRVKDTFNLADCVDAVNAEPSRELTPILRWKKSPVPELTGQSASLQQQLSPQYVTVVEPLDVLAFSNRTGRYIRTVPTAASEVDPWLVMVEHVSNDFGTIGEVFQQSQDNDKIVDSAGRRVTDLLIDSIISSNDDVISRLYHGYAFTRVPYLYIDPQPIALLVSCWNSSIEKAFRCVFDEFIAPHNPHDRDEVMRLLNVADLLMARIREAVAPDTSLYRQLYDLCSQIMQSEDIEKYLTTAYHITSLNKILLMLILPFSAGLFRPELADKFSRLSIAMLSECVMRSCRAKLRGSKMTSDNAILQCLKLSPETDLSTWRFDVAHAVRISSRLMFHPFTNCSPFAVVACMEYLQCRAAGLDAAEIARQFSAKEITMLGFVQKHLPGQKPKVTQIALYLDGMKHAQAANRQSLPRFDPIEIKETIQSEYIDLVRRQQEIKRDACNNASWRFAQLMMEAEKNAMHHRFPKMFTHEEVAELNKDVLDPLDAIVLLDNGLLLHHCCYPDCPQFLTNFMTSKDRENAKTRGKRPTRHGLMKHLAYDTFVGNYLPSFHIVTKHLSRRESDFEAFRMAVLLHYRDDVRIKSIRDLEAHLRHAWGTFRKDT